MVSGRRFVPRLKYCLAESVRRELRSLVRTAESATLVQDVRKSRLLIRLYFTTADYRVHDIMLGWKKNFGSSSEELASATMAAIQDACVLSAGRAVVEKLTSMSFGFTILARAKFSGETLVW